MTAKPKIQPTFWTEEKIEPALRKTYGNYAAAALLLSDNYGRKCARSTVFKKVQASERLKKLVEELRETTVELVELRVLQKADLENNLQAQLEYLKAFGKGRGWGKSVTEISQAPGTSLSVKVHALTKRDMRVV